MGRGTEDRPDPDLDKKLDKAFGPAEVAAELATAERLTQKRRAERVSAAPLIYGKMIEVMREVGAVAKLDEYSGGGTRYNFRGVDAVVNAVGPALRKAGVLPIPRVVEITHRDTMTMSERARPTKETRVRVEYTFWAEDGSSVAALIDGEALDTSDKGTAKAFSVALRICLLQVFAIPTSDPDPDASHLDREGQTGLTPATARYIAKTLPDAAPEEFAALWELVLDHAAAEHAVPGHSEGLTWHGLFALRTAEYLDLGSPGEFKALWSEWAALPPPAREFRVGGKDMALRIKETVAAKRAQSHERGQHFANSITRLAGLLETEPDAVDDDTVANLVSAINAATDAGELAFLPPEAEEAMWGGVNGILGVLKDRAERERHQAADPPLQSALDELRAPRDPVLDDEPAF